MPSSVFFRDAAFLLTVGSFLLTVELFLLTVVLLSFFASSLSFCTYNSSFLLTIELLCLPWERCVQEAPQRTVGNGQGTTKKLCDKDLAERSGELSGAICLQNPCFTG